LRGGQAFLNKYKPLFCMNLVSDYVFIAGYYFRNIDIAGWHVSCLLLMGNVLPLVP
jgi:hypothetical protein